MLDLGMGYGLVFSIMGMCHVTAFLLILVMIPRIQSHSVTDRATA